MTWWRDAARTIVPAPVRGALRRAIEPFEFRRRLHRMAPLLAELRLQTARDEIDMTLLGRIADLWGNPGYRADVGYLAEICRCAVLARGAVLDCGSGLSTLILGAVMEGRADPLISLEQDAESLEVAQRALRLVGMAAVDVRLAPLRSFGDFAWYDVGGMPLPGHFGLIACDGPAVFKAQWSGGESALWRAGVVPVLRARGITFDQIVLDDGEDPRCPALVAFWERAGLRTEMIEIPTGRLVLAH